MQIWVLDLHEVCVSLMYKLMHVEWATRVRRFGLNDLSKVTEISGRSGKGSEECISKGKKQLRYKTISVFKCIMPCEFYNNEFFFHAVLEKFNLVHKTWNAAAALDQPHGVHKLAHSVFVSRSLYLYCWNYLEWTCHCTSIICWFTHLGKRKRVLCFVNYCSFTLYKSSLPSLCKKYSRKIEGWGSPQRPWTYLV